MSWLVNSEVLVVWVVGGGGGRVCELGPCFATVYGDVNWCRWCDCVEYSGYL